MSLDNNLKFYDAIKKDGYLYFSCVDFNGLFRLKDGEEKAEFLGSFSHEYSWMLSMHRRVFDIDNKLVFVPYFAKGIHVYDLDSKEFRLCIPPKTEDDPEHVHFSDAFEIKNSLLMIPSNRITMKRGFFKYYPKEERGEWDCEIANKILELIPDYADYIVDIWGAITKDEYLYLCVFETNMIIKIDLKERTIEKYCAREDIKFWNISRGFLNGNAIVISSFQNDILTIFNLETHMFEYIKAPIEIMYVVISSDKIVLVPYKDKRLFISEIAGMEWKECNKPPEWFNRCCAGTLTSFFGYSITDNDELVLYPKGCNGILTFDLLSNAVKGRRVKFSDEFLTQREHFIFEDLSNRYQTTKGLIPEVVSTDIEYYLKWISK